MRIERLVRGQTQAECAEAMGVGRVAYVQMENGPRKIGALELAKLCEFWRMPYNRLFV